MKGMARGYAEDVLKPREGSEEAYARVVERFGDAPFAERDADEQAELFYELHALVAENRDLVRSRAPMEQAEEQQEGARFAIRKMPGGRRVRVPVPGGVQRAQHRASAIATSASRLKDVRAELGALGMIPGLQEAYEQKLVRLSSL